MLDCTIGVDRFGYLQCVDFGVEVADMFVAESEMSSEAIDSDRLTALVSKTELLFLLQYEEAGVGGDVMVDTSNDSCELWSGLDVGDATVLSGVCGACWSVCFPCSPQCCLLDCLPSTVAT